MSKTGCIAAAVLAAILAAGVHPAGAPQDPFAPYIPKNMKPYFLVLLVDGDRPSAKLAEGENTALVIKHLRFIRSQAQAGRYLLAGPTTDGGPLHGIAVVQASSAAEAAKVVEKDPLLESGRMKAEIHSVMLEDLSGLKFEYSVEP